MTTFEVVYLCFSTGAFIFFGVALAGAVIYSNGKPETQTAPGAARAHA